LRLDKGGNQLPPNQLEGSPSGVWGAAPAEIECVVLERGQPVLTQLARGLPSGVWGAAPAEIECVVLERGQPVLTQLARGLQWRLGRSPSRN